MLVGNRLGAAWTHPHEGGATDAAWLVARLTAILAIAAGVIHISAAGDHSNLPVMLAGFLVVAALQVLLGIVLLTRRPSRLVLAGAIALTVGSVAVWLVSRTSGLPFLEDGHMEPVGVKDGVCVLFELATLPGLLLLLSAELPRVTLPSARLGTRALSAVATATFALMVPALLLEGGEHHTHKEAVALGIHGHTDEATHDEAAHAERGHTPQEHASTARGDHRAGGHAARSEHSPSHAAAGHTQLASLTHSHGGTHGAGASPVGAHHPSEGHDQARRHSTPHKRRHAGHRDGGRKHDRGEHPSGGHGGHGDHSEPPADEPTLCLVSLSEIDVCVP
jgi:hypothetical protein